MPTPIGPWAAVGAAPSRSSGRLQTPTTAANKAAVETIATRLAEKRELYGDELVNLLDDQKLVAPQLDYTKEETWPTM